MSKQVFRYADVREKVLRAVDIISDPIRETLSPKGRNVLFENDGGEIRSTNDGATIAKNIWVKDPVMNAIISVIKSSSLKTNSAAGDGTSTTIVLSRILIKEGLKLVEDGMNPMILKRRLEEFGEKIIKSLQKQAIPINGDSDIENVANISANNDGKIAKDVVRVVKTAGLDGLIFIEPNNKPDTQIIEDTGFVINNGLFANELRSEKSSFGAAYIDVPVFITDKRLYYPEEAETILNTVLQAGHKSVVIVARDFIGQAVNVFIANHTQKLINVLLVKDPSATEKNNDALEDLATYLGGKIISEKSGSLVDRITIDDFCMASKAFADGMKTVISTTKKKNADLALRISAIRKELDKDEDDETLKKRLATLTNGMVTIRVGGRTQLEVSERIYRYEDAINAARAAMRDGYLVGGGIALKNAFNEKDYPYELTPMLRKFCQANIRQIAENCGQHPDTVVAEIDARSKSNKNIGFNALTDAYEDLLKARVIDPYKVTEMAVANSLSIAKEIISSNHLIVNELEENHD